MHQAARVNGLPALPRLGLQPSCGDLAAGNRDLVSGGEALAEQRARKQLVAEQAIQGTELAQARERGRTLPRS